MRYFFLISIILLTGCGETENTFDSLSAAEQANLRERGVKQCLEDNREDFNSFKSQSAEEFTDLERGDYYLHEVKSGSTVIRTVKIQVWKNTSGNLYFVLSTTTLEDSTPSYQFVKLTPAINAEMVDRAASARCSTGTDNVTASSNSSSITYSKETTVLIEGERKTITTKRNTASYQYLALFANYIYTQTVKTLTTDDETTDVADVTTTGTISVQTPITLAYSVYTGYTGASFCVPFVAGSPNVYTFPFTLTCGTGGDAKFPPAELTL